MRSWQLLAVIVALGLSTTTVQAGLYNPAEPEEARISVRDFAKFKETLDRLRLTPVPELPNPSPLYLRYRLAAEIDPDRVPRSWTPLQRLSLSAYYMRTKKFREAQRVLQAVRDRENFVALSNQIGRA